ncbi:basic helix-loop-helix family member taiman isoform 2-T3 [Cochliomyia hominivorax]
MSIAAAENAGLGPCELPDHWASTLSTTAATKLSTITTQTGIICSTSALNITTNFSTTSSLSAGAAEPTTTISAFTSPSTNTTTSSSTINNICNLPRSSPTAATAAVTVSNAGSSLLGLAPVVPTSAGVVPLPTTLGGVGSAGGGGGVAATSSIIANHRNSSTTTTTDSINNVTPTAAANVFLARFSALQHQQQHQQPQQQQHNLFLNNNSSLLNNNNNNNNLLPLHLQHHQHPSLHKAATTAANIAAALQRSVSMNAVASPISTNSTTSSNRKIRRKNDSKANLPQSQINKCNNEKRRRELENNYIEQLSEFLQLNKRGDMTSTKPDKAAILNQVVKTYRDICDRGQSRDISSSSSTSASSGSTTSSTTTTSPPINTATNINSNNQTTSTRCSRCATDNCSVHPVQQGEVSSTEPPLPEPSLLNGQVPEISAYFEALEHYISSVGWVLLQVNAAGIIESCTQNIRELIGYEKQELYRQPLYMYLYPGDHAKLEPILTSMTSSSSLGGNSGGGNVGVHDVNSAWSLGGETEDLGNNSGKQERSNSTKVRLLVKDMRPATQTSNSSTATNNDTNSMDQKPKYEEVVLMAAPVKDDGNSSSVLCLITRPEDESPLEMNIQQHVQHPTIEQVTFKLDIHGKIITLDATTLREPFKIHLSQWSGRLLQDLCHPQDLSALKTHLRDVQDSAVGLNALNASQSPGSGVGINPPISNVTSKPFRLRLGAPDVYVHVKANSRLFINNTPGESDFIMSVQTLLNTENDMNCNNTGMMSGNSGLLTTGMNAMSPGSSLVSSLVSNLSMDSFVNNNSVSSPLVNVSGLGGLVGGGGMPPHSTQTTNVGGPLMTSAVINGGGGVSNAGGSGTVSVSNGSSMNSQRSSYTTASTSGVASSNTSLVNSFTASPAEGPSFYSNEFDLDLPHSSFEIDPTVSAWNDSRPNSRASVTTPVSTPRPPSAGHGFSPAVCPSPSTPYQLSSHSAASLPSPQSNASQPGTGVGGGPGSFGFGFPSFDNNNEKVDKDNLNNNNNSNNNNISTGNGGVSMTGNLSNGNNQILGNSGGGPILPPNQQQQNQLQQHNTSQKPSTESERLRHLLTNKTHSSAGTSLHGSDGDDMKFYKQEDDKECIQSNMAGMFKMSQGSVNHNSMGTSRLFGMQKSANSSNPMLLSLLKSEDDEKGGSSMGRSGDMVRIKDEPHGSHGGAHNNPNNLSPEDLRRMLKHQGDPATTRKRSLNDPDDGLSAKRSDDRPSKLCENNKMLARLLQTPIRHITTTIQTGIKIIPDKVPTAIGRVSSSLSGLSNAPSCSSSGISTMANKSSTVTTLAGSGAAAGSGRGRGQHKQSLQQPSEAYLSQQQQQSMDSLPGVSNAQRPSQTQQQTHGQMEFSKSSSSSNVDHTFATPPLNTTAPSTTSTSTSNAPIGTSLTGLGDGDSELSKILDSVMDYVTDDPPYTPNTPTSLTPQQINERLAISEIQKSLMVETSAFRNGPNAMIGNQTAHQMLHQQMQQQQHSQLQPPAYPGSMMTGTGANTNNMTPQQMQQQQMQMMRMQQMLETMRANPNFQRPPPNYPARGRAPPMNAVATPGGGVMSVTQRYRSLTQQQIVQQQKERLLQQQQKQHMLVPENATARNDQMCLNPNIGTLLNTVAPNVTLSRTNMPPDSQLSPNYAQTMLQQQLSPGQRTAPFSPQSNSVGYGPQYSQSGQRLSPQQQQQLSQQVSAQQHQQQMAFQSGNAAQLSPRQPHFGNQGTNTSGNAGIPSPGIAPNASSQQWPAQAAVNSQQRGHSLQQHNPMLSAQLQGVSPYNARQYQRGRSLNSPSGTVTTGSSVVPPGPQGPAGGSMQRQNSFQANEGSGFTSATPNSPTPQSPYGTGNVFQQHANQQQMQRMQRQTSITQNSQHLPACNPASSDYVKQELRAVVSGRAAAAANSSGNGVPGGGSGNGPGVSGGSGMPSGLRVGTPQSPHGSQTSQGSMLGTNATNSMAMPQQQQPQTPLSSSGNVSNNPSVGSSTGSGSGNINNALLNTPPDPTMDFGFDPHFFSNNSAR